MLFPNRPEKSKSHQGRGVACITPAMLPFQDRFLRDSGPGRSPGGHLYVDLVNAKPYELFHIRVSFVGPAFFLGDPVDNPALAVVRINRAGVAEATLVGTGDMLLAGPLEFDDDQMARLAHAWRLPAPAPAERTMARPAPSVARCLGVVNRIHPSGNFGQITSTTGKLLFFHVSELQPGMHVAVGQRVSFIEVLTERGWNGRDVRPA